MRDLQSDRSDDGRLGRMTYKVTFDSQTQCVRYAFTGVVTTSEILRATRIGAELGFEHRRHRYLVDLEQADIRSDVIQVFQLPDRLYFELDLPHSSRIAVVVSEANDNETLVQFYRTASTNRGWRVQVFESQEQAVTWLNTETSL